MKLEITTGIHSRRRTRQTKIPMARNTKIKMDGKDISASLNYFKMEVKVNEPVYWELGMKGENTLDKLKRILRRIKWKMRMRL